MSISKADITDAMRLAMHRAPALRALGRPIPAPVAPPATAPEPVKAKRKAPGLAKPRGRKGMNRTESAMALLLEAQRQAGEIVRWGREMITLRWPDGLCYSPDFTVLLSKANLPATYPITFIETKGAFVRDDALVKFRAARAYWPDFEFQMWRLVKGRWERVL